MKSPLATSPARPIGVNTADQEPSIGRPLAGAAPPIGSAAAHLPAASQAPQSGGGLGTQRLRTDRSVSSDSMFVAPHGSYSRQPRVVRSRSQTLPRELHMGLPPTICAIRSEIGYHYQADDSRKMAHWSNTQEDMHVDVRALEAVIERIAQQDRMDGEPREDLGPSPGA